MNGRTTPARQPDGGVAGRARRVRAQPFRELENTMSDAQKKPVVKPLDNHATGGEATTQDNHATGGVLKPLDNHATGGTVKPLDNHATGEPA
ncbi:hypothetical protein SSIG_04347 [Streptomyces filamentosus NRRL 11379]|nr:hypothetical protein SSIG_04347 [Streptomyces filamentosus NRRL 11379]